MTKVKPYVVGIAGPSGAGKSSVAHSVANRYGEQVLSISLDNYFKEKGTNPPGEGTDHWESPKDVQFDLLAESLRQLKNGESASIFQYDSVSHSRHAVSVEPKSLIVVEGFLLLYPEEIRDLLDISIYLDISSNSQVERRFERQSRGWDGDTGLLRQYISDVVVTQYEIHGSPTKQYASHIISAEATLDDVTKDVLDIVENHYGAT